MTPATKPNNYEKLITKLFNHHKIPLSHPRFEELLHQATNASRFDHLPAMEKHFENEVLKIVLQMKVEEAEAREKEKAQERSIKIASERSLAPVKLNNSRLLMTLPWFSPDQKLRKDYFEYTSSDGTLKLEVHPSPKCGAAKVWDGDVLMYALSKAVEAYLETREFPKTVQFTAYEYLQQAGKNPRSGKNTADLRDKLDRLSLTNYKCSEIHLITGKTKGSTFKLCDYAWEDDSNCELSKIVIHFSGELFQYFANKNDLLTLKKGLLLEAWKEDRSGLRKRLLMLVGSHLGNQGEWKVSLKNLQGMCGHNGPLKRFNEAFKTLIPSLPWDLTIERNKKREQIVTFAAKS
jgi:Replication initiator protein A